LVCLHVRDENVPAFSIASGASPRHLAFGESRAGPFELKLKCIPCV
jgi:hypothetical protein